jgi:ubiquitin carboxyl-terminal hydrolase 4/11
MHSVHKKRKLAPFSISDSEQGQSRLYDTTRSSPSALSSPRIQDSLDSPSPASSETRLSSGAAGISQGGASPSHALAEISIDSGSMSGSDNGNSADHRTVASPGRVLGARSASPAKRTAADMEGFDSTVPGSFDSAQDAGPTDFDEAMSGMTPVNGDATQTQETLPYSADTSIQESMGAANSSVTSFGEEALPPYSAEDRSPVKIKAGGDYTTEEIGQQIQSVFAKLQADIEEGQKGVVVSNNWLQRVLSRGPEGLKDSQHPKEAREGPIGPVDNSDIVPADAFSEPILNDIEERPFIPLKPGLSITQDFVIMNSDAWGVVVASYGIAQGQKQIDRYVRNTAGPDATAPNLQYELYPPVFTVRKVPQPHPDMDEERTYSTSFDHLRVKAHRRTQGQMSPDDAVQLVSSRQEKFQKFLLRAKSATGIPKSSKVRIFKVLDPVIATTDTMPNGTLTPDVSTTATSAAEKKLVVSVDEFAKMELGRDVDAIDARDETDNPKYNGSSNMEVFVLTESATLLLEEQIGGPAGGEFESDKKKTINSKLKFSLKGVSVSQPGSTTASGRTSPAPGSGPMTRGRTRRDGRTRGTVGLNNLGNTCYMNSALQCIRSVEELAVYFLSQKFKADINMDNPLGHKGAMAKQYANLLASIYTDNNTSTFSPTMFKKAVGNFAPMFSGYGQQDSQEFLSFLVDALHEDLNRILKKPYNENPDSDDETPKDPQKIIDLGEVYRRNHYARNDSVAMDLFSGFYKNTMECPVCDKISINFDPYSLLTVQLPNDATFQHTVTFVPLHGKPVNHAIDCDKGWSVKMLKESIASKHVNVDVDRMWMVEVYGHTTYKIFENTATLGDAGIQSNDHLFIFELDAVPSNPPSAEPKRTGIYYSLSSSRNDDKVPDMDDAKGDRFVVPVFSRQRTTNGSHESIMHPTYITVTREDAQNYDTILKKTLVAVARLTSRAILTEMSEDVGDESSPDDDAQGRRMNGQVNDTSGSEDGYVNVSVGMGGPVQPMQSSNGDSRDERKVPERFMDPQYFLSPTLRNQLFTVNYVVNPDNNLHFTGMHSLKGDKAKNMYDRVRPSSRRGSAQSTCSEESSTSTGSGAQADGDGEGSETDDFDKPDIVVGDSAFAERDDSDELPDNPLHGMSNSRKGRRKNKKGKKGRRNKKYGKNNHGMLKNRPNNSTSFVMNGRQNTQPEDDEDNPYYIKLGESIVLDWNAEALDGVMAGDANDPEDFRGHFVSSEDGRGLPFVDDPELEAKKARRESRRKHGITLDECFQETGKREVLSEDNAWYCNRCKERRRATKTLEIWTCPDILVVHLKRFGGNRSFRDKIDTMVEYPIEGLDMSDRVGLKEEGKSYLYDLFAVDNHYGGLGGGHYTAIAKNFYDGEWYDYNGKYLSHARPMMHTDILMQTLTALASTMRAAFIPPQPTFSSTAAGRISRSVLSISKTWFMKHETQRSTQPVTKQPRNLIRGKVSSAAKKSPRVGRRAG